MARTLLLTLFVFFALLSVSSQAAADPKQDARARLEKMLQETKTLTWDQKIWLSKGDDEERNSAQCFYQAPDQFRLNVSEGRGAGATVVYKNGMLKAFKRGLLSFAKLTYKPRDKAVLSLRGGDITQTGFLDDLANVLRQWDTVEFKATPAEWTLNYKDTQGLPAQMKFRTGELYPYRIEVSEAGKIVETHNFSNVIYNPVIDPAVFNP
jgi:outer membrane lipoprotein-sorting protein